MNTLGPSSSSNRSDFSMERLLSSSTQSIHNPSVSTPSNALMINPLLWQSNPLFLLNSMMGCVPSMSLSSYSRRKRRHRTIFSEQQLNLLEQTFLSTQYPDVAIRERLALECSLKEERVEVWFKNRRAKERKRRKEDKAYAKSDNDKKMADSDEMCSDEDIEDDTTKRKVNGGDKV